MMIPMKVPVTKEEYQKLVDLQARLVDCGKEAKNLAVADMIARIFGRNDPRIGTVLRCALSGREIEYVVQNCERPDRSSSMWLRKQSHNQKEI